MLAQAILGSAAVMERVELNSDQLSEFHQDQDARIGQS